MFQKLVTVVGLSLPGLCFTGCGTQPPPVPMVRETDSFCVVTVPAGNREDPSSVLKRWLEKNPGRRINGISGVSSDQGLNNSAFVIEHGSGDGSKQEFHVVNNVKWSPGNDLTVLPLQQWVDEHPTRRVVAHASIAHYGGGVKGWIVCSEPK